MTRIVHLAVMETLADREVGYLTACVNRPDFQRQPGAAEVRTVGPGLEPVRTIGGLRIQPDLAVSDLDPEDSYRDELAVTDSWTRLYGDQDAAYHELVTAT